MRSRINSGGGFCKCPIKKFPPSWLLSTNLFFAALIFMLLTSLTSCTTYSVSGWERLSNVSNSFEAAQAQQSGDEIFTAKKKITVTAIRSGEIEIPLSGAINLKHPNCRILTDETMLVPVYAYLLHHQDFGYFLIDTGTCDFYASDAYGPMKGYLIPRVMVKTQLDPKEAIGTALLQHIDSLRRINAVFFTHLHFDHTSGLPDLPRPLYLVAGKGEGIPEIPWLVEPNHFSGGDHLNLLDFNAPYAKNAEPGRAVDIFGDGTLWAVSTPGHTKGHISYLVNSVTGPVFIAGDAMILHKSMQLGVGPGTFSGDVKLAQQSFDRIALFKKNHPEVKIWPGHDTPEE